MKIFDRPNLTLALAILATLVSVGFGIKSHRDERAIVAEMYRQVGNADETDLGWSNLEHEFESDGGRYLMDKNGNFVYKKGVPLGAWDRITQQDEEIKFLLSRVDRLEDRLYGLDAPEVQLLASDEFWNMARIYFIDGDLDGDGIKNGEDGCPDLPGLSGQAFYEDSRQSILGCPASTDTDNDGVADYRDACPNQPIPENEYVLDASVIRGPRSLFPTYQGCSLAQVAATCRTAAWFDGKVGKLIEYRDCSLWPEGVIICDYSDDTVSNCL